MQLQIIEKLGFKPYLGTLNLHLTQEYARVKRKLIETEDAIIITPVKGYCCGLGFKARVMDKIDGAIIIPQVIDYPENLLEIIAPVSLRKALGLREGDEVRLSVYLPD